MHSYFLISSGDFDFLLVAVMMNLTTIDLNICHLNDHGVISILIGIAIIMMHLFSLPSEYSDGSDFFRDDLLMSFRSNSWLHDHRHVNNTN